MIVVMTLIGLLAAIALPRFEAMYVGLSMDLERDRVEEAMAALPRTVAMDGHESVLAEDPPEDPLALSKPAPDPDAPRRLALPLPESWKMEIEHPIVYHASGLCEGGDVTFIYGGAERHYHLEPPVCAPVLTNPE